MQTPERINRDENEAMENDPSRKTGKQQITHNLDTGKDEPLTNLESEDDESIMNFGDGSGGGAATDGGGA